MHRSDAGFIKYGNLNRIDSVAVADHPTRSFDFAKDLKRKYRGDVMSDSHAYRYDRPDRFTSKMSTSVPPSLGVPKPPIMDPIADRINSRRNSREQRERAERIRTISDERMIRRRDFDS